MKEYKLKAGETLVSTAGGLLHNSEASTCPECGGKGGHHSAGYGSIPECSKKCSCHGRKTLADIKGDFKILSGSPNPEDPLDVWIEESEEEDFQY